MYVVAHGGRGLTTMPGRRNSDRLKLVARRLWCAVGVAAGAAAPEPRPYPPGAAAPGCYASPVRGAAAPARMLLRLAVPPPLRRIRSPIDFI